MCLARIHYQRLCPIIDIKLEEVNELEAKLIGKEILDFKRFFRKDDIQNQRVRFVK
jgi:hypothetical protein